MLKKTCFSSTENRLDIVICTEKMNVICYEKMKARHDLILRILIFLKIKKSSLVKCRLKFYPIKGNNTLFDNLALCYVAQFQNILIIESKFQNDERYFNRHCILSQ